MRVRASTRVSRHMRHVVLPGGAASGKRRPGARSSCSAALAQWAHTRLRRQPPPGEGACSGGGLGGEEMRWWWWWW